MHAGKQRVCVCGALHLVNLQYLDLMTALVKLRTILFAASVSALLGVGVWSSRLPLRSAMSRMCPQRNPDRWTSGADLTGGPSSSCPSCDVDMNPLTQVLQKTTFNLKTNSRFLFL